MGLIDADKLILHLNDYALQEAPFRGESADAYNAIKQCIEAVEEQPTAYDVDKVVEQLETTRWCDHIENWLDIDEITGSVVKVVKDGWTNDVGALEIKD